MTTQSAREYLVSKGLAKDGRGKFSNAAKEELSQAMASGIKFSDWPKTEAKSSTAPTKTGNATRSATGNPTGNSTKTETVQKNGSGMVGYTFPDEYRFPEAQWELVSSAPTKGKADRYTVREVCNTCRVSITNHACDAPSILGGIPVTLVRKK